MNFRDSLRITDFHLLLQDNVAQDFLVSYIGESGSYSVALWDSDDLEASPKSSTWIDRIGGNVMSLYDRDSEYSVTEVDANVNNHNSISFPQHATVGANARSATPTLEMDGATPLLDAWTFYIVMKPIAKVGNRHYWASADATNYPVHARYTASPAISAIQGGGVLGIADPLPDIDQWFVWSVMAKEGTNLCRSRVNNNNATTGSVSTAYGSPLRGISLNHDSSAITNAFRSCGIGVACILMRQGEDSEAETLEINTYLMEKYGIS